MNLHDWAQQWGIPPAAVADLQQRLRGAVPTDPPDPGNADTEAAVQQQIRLEASRHGMRLWRNNVGAGYTESGSVVRYGLANDSAAMNRRVKSSDLIGIRPVYIEPRHVGSAVGQFVAREVKRPGWRYRGTARERAQERFLSLVQAYGGDAGFCTKFDFPY